MIVLRRMVSWPPESRPTLNVRSNSTDGGASCRRGRGVATVLNIGVYADAGGRSTRRRRCVVRKRGLTPRLRHFAGVAADLGEARVEPVVVGGRSHEVLNLASEHLGRRSRSTRWNVPLARQFIQVDPAVARAPPIALFSFQAADSWWQWGQTLHIATHRPLCRAGTHEDMRRGRGKREKFPHTTVEMSASACARVPRGSSHNALSTVPTFSEPYQHLAHQEFGFASQEKSEDQMVTGRGSQRQASRTSL